MNQGPRKAAAYVRATKDEGRASSRRQRRILRRLAKRAGCKIIRWYQDTFAAGNGVEERPAFCRMLLDGRNGVFEVILCDRKTRFGRFSLVDDILFLSPLRRAGVKVLTARGGVRLPRDSGRCLQASFPKQEATSRGTVRRPSPSCFGKAAVFWIHHNLGAELW
jgi:DNA invertase Pin-like site-specific DNA recombinase